MRTTFLAVRLAPTENNKIRRSRIADNGYEWPGFFSKALASESGKQCQTHDFSPYMERMVIRIGKCSLYVDRDTFQG